MNAKELRIGNWVKAVDGGIETKVLRIVLGEQGTHDLYKPIPLTEAWLKVFGFKPCIFNVPDEDGVLRNKMEASESYFKHPKLKKEISIYLPYFLFNYHIGSVSVKYVHQIQNLYFALTGEELTEQ